MRSDAHGTEAIVKDGLDDRIFVFDVVVDREGKMRYAHTMVTVDDGMNAGMVGESRECLSNAIHEMVQNPCPA